MHHCREWDLWQGLHSKKGVQRWNVQCQLVPHELCIRGFSQNQHNDLQRAWEHRRVHGHQWLWLHHEVLAAIVLPSSTCKLSPRPRGQCAINAWHLQLLHYPQEVQVSSFESFGGICSSDEDSQWSSAIPCRRSSKPLGLHLFPHHLGAICESEGSKLWWSLWATPSPEPRLGWKG